MNKSNMKGNIGKHVRLFPPVLGVGSTAPGNEEWWFIKDVTDTDVKISHAGSRFAISLPYDQQHSWMDDPNQGGGIQRGALMLRVQYIAEGCNMSFVRLEQPGQPAPIATQVVANDFPTLSGLLSKLESFGYAVRWSFPHNHRPNYEEVVELSAGRFVRYTRKDGQVLVKHRR